MSAVRARGILTPERFENVRQILRGFSQHGQPVYFGQHHIKDDQIAAALARPPQSVFLIVRHIHRVTGLAQPERDGRLQAR